MANWRERLRELWNRYDKKHKYAFIGGIIALVLLFVGISFWYGSKPEYVPLYTNLETKDAGDVVNSLKETGVPYELIEDKRGATILVPVTQVHNLRLELASAGLPRGNKGFELFDDSKLGVTEFQNKINYLQALQGELTRTIEHLGSMDKARVHIVLPEDSLYKKNEKPATASILLMLKPETKLTVPEVKGIVNLVSHSVQGLSPENITIVDEQGNILNKSDDDEFEKQSAQNLRTLSQIQQMFKPCWIKLWARAMPSFVSAWSLTSTTERLTVKPSRPWLMSRALSAVNRTSAKVTAANRISPADRRSSIEYPRLRRRRQERQCRIRAQGVDAQLRNQRGKPENHSVARLNSPSYRCRFGQ